MHRDGSMPARLGMAAGISNALLPGAGELDRTTAERMVGLVTVTRV